VASAGSSHGEPLIAKITAQVAALARDLDPSEMSVRMVGRSELPVRVLIHHAASFEIKTATLKGPLTPDLQPLPDRGHLESALQQRLDEVRREAGPLIDQWIRSDGQDYHNLLPAERAMNPRPVFGVQEVCGKCSGHKQVTCPGCNGARRVTCTTCGGRGKVNCSSCGGTRQSTCYGCGGSGQVSQTAMENVWDYNKQGYVPMNVTKNVPCSGCGGSGRKACTACWDGTQTCGNCNGGGIVNCSTCGAAGVVPCDACAATGAIHHTGWIKCSIDRATQVNVSSEIPEDHQTLRTRVPFGQLSEFGEVKFSKVERTGPEAWLEYSVAVPVEAARVEVNGEQVDIRAYGPQRNIYLHHDLVGKLLAPDLAHLEASLKGNSVFRSAANSSLPAATQRFLTSEIHALLAEHPPKKGKGEPPQFANELNLHLATELVGASHLQRAAAAIAKAVPRLYGPIVLPLALWLTGIVTVLFYIARTTSIFATTPDGKFYSMVVVTAVGWVIVELMALGKLKAMLGEKLFARLKGQLGKTRMRYRLLPIAGFTFAWYATFLVFRLILHFLFGVPVFPQ
jgi:hypothetical protein